MVLKYRCDIVNNQISRFVVLLYLRKSFIARFSEFLNLDYFTERSCDTKFHELFSGGLFEFYKFECFL